MIPTGILGGSFNPAHRGHRAITLFSLNALDLDEVWWLVSPGNPLKDGKSDMASLGDRLASAKLMARRAPIRATAIEAQLRTRYTADTIRKLVRRYPKRQFIWLMGADNLGEFHRWRDWRKIAAMVPIAVIARPSYNGAALAAPAMGWLRRFVRPASHADQWTHWRPPALVLLRFRPDPSSATLLRQVHPHWHRQFPDRALRDGLTHRLQH